MQPEMQLAVTQPHTISSHGADLAWLHVCDWLIVALLVVIEVILNVIEPFHRFVGEDMITELKYPLKDNTIPFWALLIIAILVPLFVIIINYWLDRYVYDLHQASLGLLFSVFIAGVITDALKVAVGRPRPDFFWRCFPDGTMSFNPVTKNVFCSGYKSVIREGYKSFPSGHASWCFAGLGFLSWYLVGKTGAFSNSRHVTRLFIVFLPLVFAALVGVSQVNDYLHHWEDVLAGGLLGMMVASLCYLQFYPPPHHLDGWGPYLLFQAMAQQADLLNTPDEALQFQ